MIAPTPARGRALIVALGLAALALLLAACGGSSGSAKAGTSAGLSPCHPSPNASQAPTSIPEQADQLLAAGDPDAATALYDKVLADPRAQPADKLCAARGLAAIAAEPSPPKTAQQRTASGWDAAYAAELKPLQDVVVPMLVVLAVLLGLSRFATPVFVGPRTPGPTADDRRTRAALGAAYWFGVAAQTGAAVLGVLAVARAAAWPTGGTVALALCAGAVIAVGVAAAIGLFALVGRSRRAEARSAWRALGLVFLVWVGIVASDHLHGRPWLITYAVLAGAVGVVLVSRVRGIENRVRIDGRTASGDEDSGAGDRLRLRLQALGSRPAAGLELPEQTDVTQLPDDAIGLLPDGALAKAVFRVVQTFLPASPWRVTVADLGNDRLGVTILRNGRMVSATVVHGSELGVPATTAVPPGLLDVGAAAFVLAELAKRYAYLNEGLSGATRWASIAAQAAASDPTLALEADVKQALIARAIEVDPANAAARLAYCHLAYRRADSADQALAFARGLTALATHVPQLAITVVTDAVTETKPAVPGWTALQLRVLYNLAVAWLNRYLLLPAGSPDRDAAWEAADGAAAAVGARLQDPPAAGLEQLVADLRPAAELTRATITAEAKDEAGRPTVTVTPTTLEGLLSISTTYDRACFQVATRHAEAALRDLEVAASDAELRLWARTDPSMTWLRTQTSAERRFRRVVGDAVPDAFVDLPPWQAKAKKLSKHGVTSADDLAAADPGWLALTLGVSTALVTRWRELAAVALTTQGSGDTLPLDVVFLLFSAGVETRAELRTGIAQPAPLVQRLADAAATYDVDVPTVAGVRQWTLRP